MRPVIPMVMTKSQKAGWFRWKKETWAAHFAGGCGGCGTGATGGYPAGAAWPG